MGDAFSHYSKYCPTWQQRNFIQCVMQSSWHSLHLVQPSSGAKSRSSCLRKVPSGLLLTARDTSKQSQLRMAAKIAVVSLLCPPQDEKATTEEASEEEETTPRPLNTKPEAGKAHRKVLPPFLRTWAGWPVQCEPCPIQKPLSRRTSMRDLRNPGE